MDQCILIVDDDKEIVDIIKKNLITEGYKISVAYNGLEAVDIVRTQNIHLIILDVMMPKLNGIAATMKIREFSNAPILMLSAKSEGSDKVIGLSTGADDYLTKPFYADELLARVRALIRRYMELGAIGNTINGKLIRYFDLTLDSEKHKLFVREKEVRLTATEYRITELLMKNPGRVFTAEDIYSHCWDSDAYAVENTVMIHISRIRRKIELDPSKPEYLKVVWGVGYKIEKE